MTDKEKQKQHLINMMQEDEKLGLYEEPKQTVVEWLIEKTTESGHLWLTDKPYDMDELDLIIEQAKEMEKEQAERMYSEEEVIKILYQFHYDLVNSNFDTKEQWFEQFKKK